MLDLPPQVWMALVASAALASLTLGVFAVRAVGRARAVGKAAAGLETAMRNLQAGAEARIEPVDGPMAQGFNAMADAVTTRERRIRQAAMHDSDTGLANRFHLEWRLTDAARKGTADVMLAAVSIDRLSSLRLAIGYEPAADLLREVAARLTHLMPRCPVGRLSSDTLGVIFNPSDEGAARRTAQDMLSALRSPVSIGKASIDVDVTVGLAELSGGEAGARPTVEHALITVEQARAAHRKFAVFDAKAYGDPAATLSLMGEMGEAIANDDLVLHLQPRHDMRKGVITGLEALVRWKHPRLGLLSPDQFVPVAEATGHIRPMTEWVMRRAIEHQVTLAETGLELDMSVNVPGRLLADPEFIQIAINVAAVTKGRLCFDVTESAVMENPPVALTTIERFSDAGIGISIDDYGAGLSYLAHLKQIRADELKIDKAFILTVADSQKDALVVRTTIALAHSLGMKVTAEGVETDAAYALLAGMGCDIAQGFLIARPMPFEDLVRFLRDSLEGARRYG